MSELPAGVPGSLPATQTAPESESPGRLRSEAIYPTFKFRTGGGEDAEPPIRGAGAVCPGVRFADSDGESPKSGVRV